MAPRTAGVQQDPFGLGVQVLELAGVHGPGQGSQDGEHQDDGQGNEGVENVHDEDQRAARSALSTTTSELPAMPRPASQGGTRPMAASGMARTL